jgi:hypothetical protein
MILLIMGLCALPLLILGLFMKKGKGLMLLAGYNTMPKEERDKIDKQELSKTAGNLLIRMALELILLGAAIYLELTWLTVSALVIIIGDPCVSAIRMTRKLPKAKASKKAGIITAVITVIVFAAVGVMFYYGEKEPVITVADNEIRIEAMYGVDIEFSDVTEISLIDQSMEEIGAGRRTNGYGGFGDTLKGHFESDNLGGTALLFVKTESSPTIRLARNAQEPIYISFSDEQKTRALYEELIAAMPPS